MNIGTVFVHNLEAIDIQVGAPIHDPHAARTLHLGELTCVFTAADDQPKAWMDVATALSALSAAADDLWAWAIREAEKASDLRTTREMLAAQRRTDDFNLPEPQELSAS